VERLNDLKDTLAMLSGLEAKTPDDLDRYLKLIDEVLYRKHPFDHARFNEANGPVTAETLYLNQKVSDLISNAEMEQSDYRRGGRPNVFFGQYKRYSLAIGSGRISVSKLMFSSLTPSS